MDGPWKPLCKHAKPLPGCNKCKKKKAGGLYLDPVPLSQVLMVVLMVVLVVVLMVVLMVVVLVVVLMVVVLMVGADGWC